MKPTNKAYWKAALYNSSLFLLTAPDVDQGLMDRLLHINRTLSGQLDRLRNIQNTVAETENLAERARDRVDNTEQLIKTASDMLQRANMAVANVVSDTLKWNS